ncbi:MAG: AlpA family phage regulatory protein [Hydrogenophaga sp.]|nr:AlpA family phage regulatory protein [Hydrogenophaga sp.]
MSAENTTSTPKPQLVKGELGYGSMTRYVRLSELRNMVPFSVPTIWRKSRDGSFPRAIRLSAGITAWNRESVEQWLSEKEGTK